MKLLIVIVTVISVAFATLDDDWVLWKSQYAKSYEDEATESVRRLVWEHNWRFVQQHNSEGHSFEVEMNTYADLVRDVSRVCLTSLNSCIPYTYAWAPTQRRTWAVFWGGKFRRFAVLRIWISWNIRHLRDFDSAARADHLRDVSVINMFFKLYRRMQNNRGRHT